MISSVSSKNKDIVALISMLNATATTLKEMATRVLHVLHCSVYGVLCRSHIIIGLIIACLQCFVMEI